MSCVTALGRAGMGVRATATRRAGYSCHTASGSRPEPYAMLGGYAPQKYRQCPQLLYDLPLAPLGQSQSSRTRR